MAAASMSRRLNASIPFCAALHTTACRSREVGASRRINRPHAVARRGNRRASRASSGRLELLRTESGLRTTWAWCRDISRLAVSESMGSELSAEGEGFEPSVRRNRRQRFSRPPRSTTPAPLRALRTQTGRVAVERRRQRRGEERPQQRGALVRRSTPAAPRAGGSAAARPGRRARCPPRPPSGRRAVDDARDAREHDRPRAHRARLERHVERAVEQAPAIRASPPPRAAPAPRRARSGPGAARARCARADHLARRGPRPRRSARRRARAPARPRAARAA